MSRLGLGMQAQTLPVTRLLAGVPMQMLAIGEVEGPCQPVVQPGVSMYRVSNHES
jgi:hypothetical protein